MAQALPQTSLPSMVDVVSGRGLWMDGEALRELERAAALPGCVRALGLPDLSPGSGTPVGVALAFEGALHPVLLGSDAGCGVRLDLTDRGDTSLDKLERRVLGALDEEPLDGLDPGALARAAWQGGPAGLAGVAGLPEGLQALATGWADRGPLADTPSGPPPEGLELFGGQLGTIGGGNHFIEVAQVRQVLGPERAARHGLVAGQLVTLVHSGSRGVGHLLPQRWPVTLEHPQAIAGYLGELAGACRFAQCNRLVLAFRLLSALRAIRPGKHLGAHDLIHNQVSPFTLEGRPVWLHRKGVAPARRGELSVVLGTRGSRTFLVEGTGLERGLDSVAHGAGRRMRRSEALAKMKAKHRRDSLRRTGLGSRVICDRPELLYEEHPDVYKDSEAVHAALVEAALVEPVAALEPLITVKR